MNKLQVGELSCSLAMLLIANMHEGGVKISCC